MPTEVLLAMVAGGAGWQLLGDLCASLVKAAMSLAHRPLPHRPLPDPTGEAPTEPDLIGPGFWHTHTALQAPERRP